MPEQLQWLIDLIQPHLPWLISLSVLMALASMILIPLLIVRMPADYFAHRRRHRHWTVTRILVYVFRNIIALLLFLAGAVMLILPGQGLLTILIAVVVSDVPGKYQLEKWVLRQKGVLKAMNWIRKRYEQVPIVPPQKSEQ
ncbi:hypothetical protein [Aliidiomarina sanyensis]|uniref:Transmembrane protein (PGPGW) n=1 Tax=Aliidiomarina sanyensis TaxID=1249555 RepID=A0A432WBG3_9GAMM|nr:hypothetical protein [Aliidiomarina sanyensis]RUO28733.1 hypothetical protein CWE11_10545 [Aliidiomarina sanyensis]